MQIVATPTKSALSQYARCVQMFDIYESSFVPTAAIGGIDNLDLSQGSTMLLT